MGRIVASMRITPLVLVASLAVSAFAQTKVNVLSAKEKAAGWTLLFDGKDFNGWHSGRGGPVPSVGWAVQDDSITVTEAGGEEGGNAGDIITDRTYGNFELSLDFKTSPGANSGIMYFVDPATPAKHNGKGSLVGYEYQILDDNLHPDAKRGKDGDRTVASLYDMIPAAKDKPIHAVGEWNTARIVVRGQHCEHWLNGVKVLEYDRDSPQFRAIVAGSKFAEYPGYAERTGGYLLLQDHGFPVWYRNVKIRELK